MPHIRMRDGQALHVRMIGRGEPCLLVHGFGSASGSWLPFVTPLLHRRRFILPDLRGFGQSHQVPLAGGCALTQFAEDLEDVLASQRIERLPVLGISMGALTTVKSFQLFGGRRFSRYMHIDQGPVIRNFEGYPYGLLGAAQGPFFARLQTLLDIISEGHMHMAYDELPREVRAEFWTLFGQFAIAAFTSPAIKALLQRASHSETIMRRVLPVDRWQVYFQIIRSYLQCDYDLREVLRSIEVPLTVLIGGSSTMYPPAGQRAIADYAPHANVIEWAGVGHNVPYEAPRKFMRALELFITD